MGVVVLALAVLPSAWATGKPISVGYSTPAALKGLHVIFRIDALQIAEVAPLKLGAPLDLTALRARPGIRWAQPTSSRTSTAVPQLALTPTVTKTGAAVSEWQFSATGSNLVPSSVLRSASTITIAVVDTGADLSAPALAAKVPLTYSVLTGDGTVTDTAGHGTFVASLAAGSAAGVGLVHGFGGDARLMIVQAGGLATEFTDADESAAIVWAVDHGARILNLSLGGLQTSQVEQDAIAYAINRGVLIVAAAGNEGQHGNVPTYPAALLGSAGLAIGASTNTGKRATFSTSASYISLVAPGVNVLGALSSASSPSLFPRATIPQGIAGLYGYGSGTSFATAEVAGAAALVWGAKPSLTAAQVIQILEQTASQAGKWNSTLGFGVVNVAAAVARVTGKPVVVAKTTAKAKVVKSKTRRAQVLIIKPN